MNAVDGARDDGTERRHAGEIPRFARDGSVPGSVGAPRNDSISRDHGDTGTLACAGSSAPAVTLAEASRDRLAKRVLDPKLWKEYERITGEKVDPKNPPTWAEVIAAREAHRAATSPNGTRDAKELRDAAEGGKDEPARVAFLFSLEGLPRTNAVAGK